MCGSMRPSGCNMSHNALRVLVVALLAVPGMAQTNFGRISGTIYDTSGAVVPATNVVITDTDTQAVRTAVTDDRGFYVAENLPVGPYSVTVDRPGFRRT